jgi:hypothetical protein
MLNIDGDSSNGGSGVGVQISIGSGAVVGEDSSSPICGDSAITSTPTSSNIVSHMMAGI